MQIIKSLLICGLSLSLSACAATARFNSTPIEESDFQKERSYLRSEYADIDKYDRFFAGPYEAPPIEDLEKKWGQPDSVKKRWVPYALNIGIITAGVAIVHPAFASFYLLNPYPQEHYVWNKGNYQITAYGRRDLLTRYEKRVHRWKWAELKYVED